MFFTASKIFWMVAAPANLLALLLVLALVLMLFKRRRTAGLVTGFVTAVLIAVWLLPVGDWLLRPLEDRFPRPELPASVAGILVLGGTGDGLVTESRGTPTLNGSSERLVAMVRLSRHYPDAPVIFSGGSGRLIGDEPSESEVLQWVLEDLGIDPGRFIWESRARTTSENAALTRALVPEDEDGAWLLVTSAWHVPRSVATFRAAGWSVIPYPVDYRTSAEEDHLPTFSVSEGMRLLNLASREWIGLLAYRLTGRSAELFPGPGIAG